ncbi:hypothetical protein IWX49DRAFT_573942 [Phyllosticta citricarpa]
MRPPPARIHVFFTELLSPHLSTAFSSLSLSSLSLSLSLSLRLLYLSLLRSLHIPHGLTRLRNPHYHLPNNQCRRAVPSLRLQACSSCCSCRLAIVPTAPATQLCSHTLVSVSLLIRLIPLLQSEPAARRLARASASLVGLVIRLLLI